ncbi:putative polysaccharide export protein wza [Nymphon striatum]|nr:putative polysaccharide export protein wza [Nymphon striatum]
MPVFKTKFEAKSAAKPIPGKDFRLVSLNTQTISKIPKIKSQIPKATGKARGTGGYKYRIGAQDILSITVWDHPELTIPAGEFRSPTAAGHKVGNDGFFFFPFAGRVKAAGRTSEQVRLSLQQKLAKYITNPQVGVSIAAYRSQRAYISGQVLKPGVYQIDDTPLTVRDAIAKAGGLKAIGEASRDKEAAEYALLTTSSNKKHVIDLDALFRKGENKHNYVLRGGDSLHIPDRDRTEKVFVMGEVNKPAWSEALSDSGGIKEETANPSGIFVVRKEKATDKVPTVYQLNLRSVHSLMLAEQFNLRKRDIVYVTAAPISRWNRVITQILPSLDSATSVDNLANPMGEVFLKNIQPELNVFSSGVGALVGKPADPMACELMLERDIDLGSHCAQQINSVLVSASDLILTMEQRHISAIQSQFPESRGKVHLIGKWSDNQEVPDPYKKDKDAFVSALTIIESGLTKWQQKLWN